MVNDAVDRTTLLICEQSSHTTWGRGICDDGGELTDSGTFAVFFSLFSCFVVIIVTSYVYPSVLILLLLAAAFVVRDTFFLSATFAFLSIILVLKHLTQGSARSPQGSEAITNGVSTLMVMLAVGAGAYVLSSSIVISTMASLCGGAVVSVSTIVRNHSSFAGPGTIMLLMVGALLLSIASHQGYTYNHIACMRYLTRGSDIQACVEASILRERLFAKEYGIILSEEDKSRVETVIAKTSGFDHFMSRAGRGPVIAGKQWGLGSPIISEWLMTVWTNVVSDVFGAKSAMSSYGKAVSRPYATYVMLNVMFGCVADSTFETISRISLDHGVEGFKSRFIDGLTLPGLLSFVPYTDLSVLIPQGIIILGIVADGVAANLISIILVLCVAYASAQSFKNRMLFHLGGGATSRIICGKVGVTETSQSELSRHKNVVVEVATALAVVALGHFSDMVLDNGSGLLTAVLAAYCILVLLYFYFGANKGDGLDVSRLNKFILGMSLVSFDPLVIVNLIIVLFSGGYKQLYKGLRAPNVAVLGDTAGT
jgi:hypothetical protein